jgi:DMSO reductase family type II enzyme heme b subunit
MPAHRDDYTVEERWAVTHYVMSLGPVDKGQRDETIVATQVDEIPGEDAGWEDIEQFRFMTTANVIQPPRNFWATVEYVKAQAVYTEDEIALRIQWDDRSQSTGNWCVDGSKKDENCVTDEDCGTSTCGGEPIVDFEYPRETTDILHGTHHPDQFLVQFPVKTSDPSRRPYFMMGDSKMPVNLWWWRGDTNTLEDKNAKGARNITNQSEQSQTLDGGVSYEDGRYTMVIRRTLTTENARGDIQFEAGKFLPIAFQVWDGERGEVGQRRALTTWYWLYLRPAPEAAPAGLPGIRLNYAAPVAFFVSLLFLLGVFALIRRSHAANAGKEAEAAEDATETVTAS